MLHVSTFTVINDNERFPRSSVETEYFFSGLPYIRLIPKVTAVAGEKLRLKCPVAGYPIEEIKWERANRELPDDLRQKVLPDGTLVIISVQKKIDAGVYTCWARNKQGHSARRSGDVAVIGKALVPRFEIYRNVVGPTKVAIRRTRGRDRANSTKEKSNDVHHRKEQKRKSRTRKKINNKLQRKGGAVEVERSRR